MKQVIKTFIAILIILGTTICIDIVFGRIADHFFIEQVSDKFSYALNSKDDPRLVFFGSSRCENHYDTYYLRDSLHLSTFNMGEAGRNLTYHNAAIAAYLRNHRPEMIVLDLMPDELSGSGNNRIKPLYRYVDIYPEIAKVAYKSDLSNKFLLNSHLLRYNSEIVNLIKKERHPFSSSSQDFVPLKMRNDLQDLVPEVEETYNYVIDDISSQCLHDIDRICQAKDVKLVVTISPENIRRGYTPPIVELCNFLDIPVFDMRGLFSQESPDGYFYDNRHLNGVGAREFTKQFMKHLNDEKLCQK